MQIFKSVSKKLFELHNQGSWTSGKSGKIEKPYHIQGFSGKFKESQGNFCLEGDESGKIRGKVFSITKNVFLQI